MKIGGIYYEVLHKTSEEMNGNVGLADFNRQEISINTNHTMQTQRIALVHEVLHILDNTYNLKLTEEQVTFTAHALVSFIEDNKDFLANLL
jgi:Zn-dependent peptidase ImmA (M78 family)